MKKIAIVGVEGSGKTVMMAAMGEQWERPDDRGYFLSPENAEAFGFSKSVMAILRSGRWPNASSHDEMRTLAWSLQRRQGGNLEKIADISMLDYAGEVYRQAFGGEKREGYDSQVATLRSHVDEADVLIVLVNLSDIISGSMSNRRTRDAMWLTKSVLDYALQGKSQKPHAAIVFTQADSYREIISANGGEAATLKKYLPHVANLYGELPIFSASAIDKTVIGSDGLPIPAPDFKSTGLKELMEWMIDDCQNSVYEVRRIADEKRQRAIDLFRQKRYDDAFEATRAAYRDGDDELAYQLAYMYRFGKGTQCSFDRASELLLMLDAAQSPNFSAFSKTILSTSTSEKCHFALGTLMLVFPGLLLSSMGDDMNGLTALVENFGKNCNTGFVFIPFAFVGFVWLVFLIWWKSQSFFSHYNQYKTGQYANKSKGKLK